MPRPLTAVLISAVWFVLSGAAGSGVSADPTPAPAVPQVLPAGPAALQNPPALSLTFAGGDAFDESAAAQVAARPRSARMRDIQRVVDAEQNQLALLRAQLVATEDPERRLALQRQAVAIKCQARLEVFRVQLDHARRAGAADGIRRLESNVRGWELRAARSHAAAAQPAIGPVAR